MTLNNQYPKKALHNDIDNIIKSWSDLYVVGLSRNKYTKQIIIQFQERSQQNKRNVEDKN